MGFRFASFLLQSLLRTADFLKIKGLCELTENREETNNFLNATLAGHWPPHAQPAARKRTKVGLGSSSTGVCPYTIVNGSPGSSKSNTLDYDDDLIEIDLTEDPKQEENLTSISRKDQADHSTNARTKDDRLTTDTEEQQTSLTTNSNNSKQDKMASLGMGMGMVSTN